MRKLASCFLLAVVAFAGQGSKRKISSDLSKVTKATSVQVIVQWNPDAAETAQKITALGGKVIAEFTSVHSGVYVMPSSAVDNLANDDDVKFISVDRQVHKKAASIADYTSNDQCTRRLERRL